MTISTYTDLLSNIDNWIGRTDLDSYTPTMVQLFESYANRKLRVRQMETSTDLTTTNGAATLPSDYLGFRSVTYNGSGATTTTGSNELLYKPPTLFRALMPLAQGSSGTTLVPGGPGKPQIFTIEGSTFTEAPVDDTSTTRVRYYQQIPALITNSTNWLLTAYPDAYLFGSLAEAYGLAISPDKLSMWKARRDEVMQEITNLDEATKGGGAITPIGWIP